MENFVKDLIKEHETNNPFVICRNLKIRITYIDSSEMKGAVTKILGKPCIFLSSYLEGFSKYFALSHELCHAIKHDIEEVKFFKDNTFYSTDKFEIEANEFAALLLKNPETQNYDIDNLDDLDREVEEELVKFIYKNS